MTNQGLSARVLLVADPRPLAPELGSALVRRYRLARLRFAGRATDGASRFEHLKQTYD